MQEWWDTINTLEQVYWIIALVSTVLLLVIVVMTFIGGTDADMGHVDVDVDADTGIGFQFFTLKNLVGFLTMFAWSGLACIRGGQPSFVVLLVSIVCGLIMMYLMAQLFKMINKQSESGTLQMKNAIGQVGEVYLTIGKSRSNIGKIQIKVQGSLRELDALTDESTDLVQGNMVKVKSLVSDEILLVEKLTK